MDLQIPNATGSLIRSMEIIAVLHRLKPVTRQLYPAHTVPEIITITQQLNLYCVQSPLSVSLHDKKPFSHKGTLQKDPHTGMVMLYLSRDELAAKQALLAELKQDHATLGALLGYPNCCISFFCQHRAKKQETDFDLSEEVVAASGPGPYPSVNNIFMREKDLCLLSHFPCSLHCSQSEEYGKNIALMLKQQGILWPKQLRQALYFKGNHLEFV